MKKRLQVLLVIFIALTAVAPAQAYIDPGSGMLIWQGLLSALGVFLVFVRNPWKSLKMLLARLKRKNEGS